MFFIIIYLSLLFTETLKIMQVSRFPFALFFLTEIIIAIKRDFSPRFLKNQYYRTIYFTISKLENIYEKP